MRLLEIPAVAISATGVWLTTQRKMLCWPIGLSATFLYGWIFWDAKLYSDMLLEMIYAGLQVYGWWRWSEQKNKHGAGRVEQISARTCCAGLLIGAAGGAACGYLMSQMTDASLPWLDAALTSFSLIAQFWMTRRYLACWRLWIAVDIVYVCVYTVKALHLTAALYVTFIIQAIIGMRCWKRALALQTRTGNA